MREAGYERAFVRAVKAAGGEVRKMIWPGRRHAPDRLVFWPKTETRAASMELVELKKPGEKPRPGQAREYKRLRSWGFHVFVIDCHEDIAIYVEGR